MISVYKGFWQDRYYLVATEVGGVKLHKALGIPYWGDVGLRTKGVTKREMNLAASSPNSVYTKSGGGFWTYERKIDVWD